MNRINEDGLFKLAEPLKLAEPRFNGRLNLKFVDDELAFIARAVEAAYDLIVELRKLGVNKIGHKCDHDCELSFEEFDYYVERLFDLCVQDVTMSERDRNSIMKIWRQSFDFVANVEDMFD